MALNYEPLRTSDPIADAERYASRDIPTVGKCCVCKEDIPIWADYYEIDDDLICDDCLVEYMQKYKKSNN